MKAKDKGLLLHMGLAKTGTTTLQKALFEQHSEIFYLGKYVNNKTISKNCRNEQIHQLLKPIIWSLNQNCDYHQLTELYQNSILPSIPEGKHIIASWEALARSPVKKHVKRLTNLKNVFGNFRLLFTIRNPITQLPSRYLQNLKGNFTSFDKRFFEGDIYNDIDTWMKNITDNKPCTEETFSYARNIQQSVEILGVENVGVFVFEELCENPEAYYRKLCEFIGINADEALTLISKKHFHPRITEEQISYIKSLHESKWKQWLAKKFSNIHRKMLLRKKANGKPAKVTLPTEWQDTVKQSTARLNRWIADTYQLPLDKYNYPLS